MTNGMNRRRLLKGAMSMAAAATCGALTDRSAHAASAQAPKRAEAVRHAGPAYASIDQCLQRSVENGVVAGVVAMGATQRGLVYEASARTAAVRAV
jgi:methyl acetate hydrolase